MVGLFINFPHTEKIQPLKEKWKITEHFAFDFKRNSKKINCRTRKLSNIAGRLPFLLQTHSIITDASDKG